MGGCGNGRKSRSLSRDANILNDVDVSLAHCAKETGDAPGAAALYMSVLERTEEKHVEVRYRILIILLKADFPGILSRFSSSSLRERKKNV